MRKKIIAGNWKMNHGPKEAADFFSNFNPSPNPIIEWVIFPPYVTLSKVKELVEGKHIKYGAQCCHSEASGAFTGEIGAGMLEEMGCKYVLVGHSERRQFFGETNLSCAKKISQILAHGMIPMYCIGETKGEREGGKTESILKEQLIQGLTTWSTDKPLVIAYEPVWAIGTGAVASPAMAEESHKFIRKILVERCGAERAAEISILYGGSVKPENSSDLAAQPNIDGFLVGGASLIAKSFAQIGHYPL